MVPALGQAKRLCDPSQVTVVSGLSFQTKGPEMSPPFLAALKVEVTLIPKCGPGLLKMAEQRKEGPGEKRAAAGNAREPPLQASFLYY